MGSRILSTCTFLCLLGIVGCEGGDGPSCTRETRLIRADETSALGFALGDVEIPVRATASTNVAALTASTSVVGYQVHATFSGPVAEEMTHNRTPTHDSGTWFCTSNLKSATTLLIESDDGTYSQEFTGSVRVFSPDWFVLITEASLPNADLAAMIEVRGGAGTLTIERTEVDASGDGGRTVTVLDAPLAL